MTKNKPMKIQIETDDNSFWGILTLTTGIVLLAIILGGYWLGSVRTKAAFSAGLIEVPDHASGTHYGR